MIESSDSISQSSIASNATAAKKKEFSTYINNKRISREITKLESDRRRMLAARGRRLRHLRESRRNANNNLAGATWQQILAQEQLAATQEADIMVSSIDRQIEQLKKDIK